MLKKTKEFLVELLKKLKKLIPILRSSEAESVYKLFYKRLITGLKSAYPHELVEFLTSVFLFFTSLFLLLFMVLVVILFVGG